MNLTEKAIERYKCNYIKELLEQLSGVQDISIRNRKREFIDLRKCYCTLCKTFTKAASFSIGSVLSDTYDHATVDHAAKTFHPIYSTGQLTCNKVYENAHKHLVTTLKPITNNSHFRELIETEIGNRVNYVKIYINIISEYEKKISELTKDNDLI